MSFSDAAWNAYFSASLEKLAPKLDQLAQPRYGITATPLPEPLFHYTSMEGFMGITSSRKFWATDYRYLNDSSELTYAFELIDRVISRVRTDTDLEPRFANALPHQPFADQFERNMIDRRIPFITSFTDDGDLLSQWRAYTNNEAGIALGVDLNRSFFPKNDDTRIRRVIYDCSEQELIVENIIRTIVKVAASPEIHELDVYPRFFEFLLERILSPALIDHAVVFKNVGFKEENEYRLIKMVNTEAEISRMQSADRASRSAASMRRMIEMLELDKERSFVPFADAVRAEADAASGQASTLQPVRNAAPAREGDVAWDSMEEERVRQLEARVDAADAESKNRAAAGVDIHFRRSNLGIIPYVEVAIDEWAFQQGKLPLQRVVQGPRSEPQLAIQSLGQYLRSLDYDTTRKVELAVSAIPLRS